jgi:hypothetical protein
VQLGGYQLSSCVVIERSKDVGLAVSDSAQTESWSEVSHVSAVEPTGGSVLDSSLAVLRVLGIINGRVDEWRRKVEIEGG